VLMMGRLRLDAWDLVPCGIVSLPAKVTPPTTLKEIPPIKSHGQSQSRRECLDKNTFRWPDMYPASACSTPFRRAYGWPGSENTATNHENVYLNFPSPPCPFFFPRGRDDRFER